MGVDIEFIICWSDGSWTTESKLIENPPLDGNDGLATHVICQEYADEVALELASVNDIKPCPRGSIVHVGIYHIGEDNRE